MANALSMSMPIAPFDMSKAKRQHEAYIQTMKHIFPSSSSIIELQADENHPDCVFIEDTAVVIDNCAVICRIGADSRRGEVDDTKNALLELGIQVLDMREDTNLATCDGGDVLYPVSYHFNNSPTSNNVKRGGKQLFVGISSRTNQEGADYLQKAFPNVNVIPVKLRETQDALHLKSVVTHIDEETLILPSAKNWDYIVDIVTDTDTDYKIVRVPDITACNVVSVNGHILAQSNICSTSREVLHEEIVEKRGMSLHFVDACEFAKFDGALSCKSILIP